MCNTLITILTVYLINVYNIMPLMNSESFLVFLYSQTLKIWAIVPKSNFECNRKIVNIHCIESAEVSVADLQMLHFMKYKAFYLRMQIQIAFLPCRKVKDK